MSLESGRLRKLSTLHRSYNTFGMHNKAVVYKYCEKLKV